MDFEDYDLDDEQIEEFKKYVRSQAKLMILAAEIYIEEIGKSNLSEAIKQKVLDNLNAPNSEHLIK